MPVGGGLVGIPEDPDELSRLLVSCILSAEEKGLRELLRSCCDSHEEFKSAVSEGYLRLVAPGVSLPAHDHHLAKYAFIVVLEAARDRRRCRELASVDNPPTNGTQVASAAGTFSPAQRQEEIFALVQKGLNLVQIGDRLGLSPSVVQRYLLRANKNSPEQGWSPE